ncbi:MAG TPA: nitroreductase family protein [Candidatus Hydrogenedentes bacterium]|nr:nitroreductase family protein [Candidatus Hydrogenedentota bacterium]
MLVSADAERCARDGWCIRDCPVQILGWGANGLPEALPELEPLCLNCGHCIAICPHAALTLRGMRPEELESAPAAMDRFADPVMQVLKTRRSVRLFLPKPVPRELLMRLLDATRWAPSATNRQPVHWLIIESHETMRELSRLIADGLRSIPYFARMVESFENGEDRMLRGAPQLVVAHASKEGFDPLGDCTIALEYLDLAAQAHGLGTCWAGVLVAAIGFKPEIRSLLGIPDDHRVCGAMMIGYPRQAYARIPQRNPLRVTWA